MIAPLPYQGDAPPAQDAAHLAASLPALVLAARHLQASLTIGLHGRRRAGVGEDFWQYRPATAGDLARSIDWRRSARSDQPYMREREWQAVQRLLIWVDHGAGMGFRGAATRPSKAHRALVLALALAQMALRGGEAVGIWPSRAPRIGQYALDDLARDLCTDAAALPDPPDHAPWPKGDLPHGARVALFGDFLGPIEGLGAVMAQVTQAQGQGILVQVLDPVEEVFPFAGRVLFQSMSGAQSFETLSAHDLRAAYRDRLAARKAELAQMAARQGWRYVLHHSDQVPSLAMIALVQALGAQGAAR